jgi:membrane dipeptidase
MTGSHFSPLIVDAHEDLAWNMLTFNRDYTQAASTTRQTEQGTETPALNGDTLLGYPDYTRGRVGVVFSTLFNIPRRYQAGAWDTLSYETAEQAHQLYRRQVDRYNRLADEHPGKFRLIHTRADLQNVLSRWEAPEEPSPPVGLVILMEGAEGIRQPEEVEDWWQWGVRIIGPAWSGTRFCGGSREPGPLTAEGYRLLEAMAGLGFTLDITHMDAQAALQALDFYPAGVIASHSNASARIKGAEGNRHLPDEVIRSLIERQGVIGIVPLNPFLSAGWKPGDGRQAVTLHHVVDQIDYICQMSGSAAHVGLGTDFDGGFGVQVVPAEIDTIADLQKLVPHLLDKGYSKEDIAAISGGNWLEHLKKVLPESL